MPKPEPMFPPEQQEEGIVLLCVATALLAARLIQSSGPSQEQFANASVEQAEKLILAVKKKLREPYR